MPAAVIACRIASHDHTGIGTRACVLDLHCFAAVAVVFENIRSVVCHVFDRPLAAGRQIAVVHGRRAFPCVDVARSDVKHALKHINRPDAVFPVRYVMHTP